MLARMRKSQREISRATGAAKAALASARRKEKESRRQLRDVKKQRLELLAEARRHVEAAREERRRMHSAVERQEMTREWLEEAADRLRKQTQELRSAASVLQPFSVETELPPEGLETGDTVWVSSLNQIGQVLGLAGAEAEVQIGTFRAKVPTSDLEKRPSATGDVEGGGVHVGPSSRPMPGVELLLLGWRVEDALPHLDKYLDDAYLAALPYVRIVHGKGTGALRHSVRDALADHPLVASFRAGKMGEGGDGVTVVKFVPKAPG